jgi:DNA-binding transcriptional regulator LsrR (DeoR family)
MNKLPSTMNDSNNKQSNLEWRRNRIVELYSEGRNQSQIAQILKISQPTVFRDLQYQRRQSRNKVKTYLDEYVPFEHNTCQVGINKILRKAWDIINDDDSSENAVFKALSLAKDCYIVKNDLLGDKTVIVILLFPLIII